MVSMKPLDYLREARPTDARRLRQHRRFSLASSEPFNGPLVCIVLGQLGSGRVAIVGLDWYVM